MEINNIQAVYFIGAGGIGMSCLERYFLSIGKTVGGYDRTPSTLTEELQKEGVLLHFEDDPAQIPAAFRQKESTLVVFTPAIPENHKELAYFRQAGFEIHKRAQVLGTITRASRGLCVAGTHGKTTTSTMLAHILHCALPEGCTAFLGGISQNYHSNLILPGKSGSPFTVIEADEFDRSFHWLQPDMAVVTATDPDHLDIYGTKEAYLESFRHFTSLIRPGGVLLLHEGTELKPDLQAGTRLYTYARQSGDFHAEHIQAGGGEITFDLVAPTDVLPGGKLCNISLGVPVSINIDNGIAAMAIALLVGADPEKVKEAMASFRGVERRFDFKIRTPQKALLSDYAHHPQELRQSLLSLRELYPGKKITALFQPHLYSRTRDFYAEFADALSQADAVILTEIYPAREQPIPGVSSQLIYDRLRPGIERALCLKKDLHEQLEHCETDVLAVLGAGDLDALLPKIEAHMRKRWGIAPPKP